jgi:hypothetical protein
VSGYYLFKPQSRVSKFNDRSPASIRPVEMVKSEEPTFFTLDEIKKPTSFQTSLNFDCQEIFGDNAKPTAASVTSDHVILKLSHCAQTLGHVKKIELMNKTNGYNAQLFKLNKAEFNSDFIQLDKGVNQLEFEISLIDGQKKSQVVKIQRIQ